MSRFVPRLSLCALAVAALWLSGCAVRPTPLTGSDLTRQAQADRTAMFSHEEPVKGPITLDEAMARALRYNLDHRQKMMEEALGQRQLDVSNFDMLPKLTTDAGYTARNHYLVSSSEDYLTGGPSLPPSYSADKTDKSFDLAFTWNILDFGVSYFEAKQQADRVLVLEQRRRKVVQLMMQQVREAYWQAAGAQRLGGHIAPLLKQAEAALDDSRKAQQEQLTSPLNTLNYQRELLDMIRQLEAIRYQLDEAKPKLAALMNLEPGEDYTLAPPTGFAIPTFDMPMPKMEETALERRPELVEADYNARIGVNQTREALAKLLPGIEIELGTHYDSNSFLTFHSWRDAGLQVSWNLLNVLNAKNIRGVANAKLDVAKAQRLALSMAVLTQVHVARIELDAKERQFDLARQLDDVDQQILVHTSNAEQASAEGKLAEIRAAATAMMSELRLFESYGEMEGAYGQLLATLGLDPVPDTLKGDDLASIEQAIGQEQQRWRVLGQAGAAPVATAQQPAPGPTLAAAAAHAPAQAQAQVRAQAQPQPQPQARPAPVAASVVQTSARADVVHSGAEQ